MKILVIAISQIAQQRSADLVVAASTSQGKDYADFALIADAYEAIPKMLEELKSA